MIVTSRGRALHVPVFLVTFTAMLFAVSVRQVIVAPGVGVAFSALLCGALFVAMTLDLRSITARDGKLVVRSPHKREQLELARAALSIRVAYGTRGGRTYIVYASDGWASADLSDHWSERGAERALRRLEGALLDAAPGDHVSTR